MDMCKLCYDLIELLIWVIQFFLWLMVFGQVFVWLYSIFIGGVDYFVFLVLGVFVQSVFFVVIFNGIFVIWECDLGIVYKFFVILMLCMVLVFGKVLVVGLCVLMQVFIVYVFVVVLGVKLVWSVLVLLGVVVLIFFGVGLFLIFLLIVVCIVKICECFMGIGQVLIMLMFFVSNVIYFIDLMLVWFKVVVYGNLLIYFVDGLCVMMLGMVVSGFMLIGDFVVLVVGFVVLVLIGGWMYFCLIIQGLVCVGCCYDVWCGCCCYLSCFVYYYFGLVWNFDLIGVLFLCCLC